MTKESYTTALREELLARTLNDERLQELLSLGADPNLKIIIPHQQNEPSEIPLLHHVMLQGNTTFFDILLSQSNINIKIKSSIGFSTFHQACCCPSSYYLEKLAEKAREKNILKECIDSKANDARQTPLIRAAYSESVECIKFLLSLKDDSGNLLVDINSKETSSLSAIHAAAKSKNVEVIKALLEPRDNSGKPFINVNITDSLLNTALMYAIREDALEIVEELINLRDNTGKLIADVNATNDYGQSALGIAISHAGESTPPNSLAIFKKLLELGDELRVNDLAKRATHCSSNHLRSEALSQAASRGKAEYIDLLLERSDIDINVSNSNGDTALMIASQEGFLSIVHQLLSHKNSEGQIDINVNAQNIKGDTALMMAVVNKRVKIVQELLTNPSLDINKTQKEGYTALQMVCESGYTQEYHKILIELLSHEKIELNILNSLGSSPLGKAITTNNIQAQEAILASGKVDFKFLLGEVRKHLARRSEIEDGNKILQFIIAKAADNHKALIALGESIINQDDFKGHLTKSAVIELLRKAADEKGDKDAAYLLGEIYSSLSPHNFGEAIKYFTIASASSPSSTNSTVETESSSRKAVGKLAWLKAIAQQEIPIEYSLKKILTDFEKILLPAIENGLAAKDKLDLAYLAKIILKIDGAPAEVKAFAEEIGAYENLTKLVTQIIESCTVVSNSNNKLSQAQLVKGPKKESAVKVAKKKLEEAKLGLKSQIETLKALLEVREFDIEFLPLKAIYDNYGSKLQQFGCDIKFLTKLYEVEEKEEKKILATIEARSEPIDPSIFSAELLKKYAVAKKAAVSPLATKAIEFCRLVEQALDTTSALAEEERAYGKKFAKLIAFYNGMGHKTPEFLAVKLAVKIGLKPALIKCFMDVADSQLNQNFKALNDKLAEISSDDRSTWISKSTGGSSIFAALGWEEVAEESSDEDDIANVRDLDDIEETTEEDEDSDNHFSLPDTLSKTARGILELINSTSPSHISIKSTKILELFEALDPHQERFEITPTSNGYLIIDKIASARQGAGVGASMHRPHASEAAYKGSLPEFVKAIKAMLNESGIFAKYLSSSAEATTAGGAGGAGGAGAREGATEALVDYEEEYDISPPSSSPADLGNVKIINGRRFELIGNNTAGDVDVMEDGYIITTIDHTMHPYDLSNEEFIKLLGIHS